MVMTIADIGVDSTMTRVKLVLRATIKAAGTVGVTTLIKFTTEERNERRIERCNMPNLNMYNQRI